MAPARGTVLPFAAICGVFGLYGWAVFALAFRHDGVIGPRYNAPGTDWMVYYAAARAALAGDLSPILDGARLTAALNERFADWLSGPLSFHPWVYPPHFLLLLVPFALLPFGLACAAFLALSFAGLAAASAQWVEGPGERFTVVAALLLCPAASINAVTGQNGFLTAALLVGGIGLAVERPLVAGILLGALTYKPQFWLMVPVALVAAGRWRTLAYTLASALAWMLASLVAFGVEPWRAWLILMLDPPADFSAIWRQWSILWGEDVYTAASLLGLSAGPAKALQLVAALIAAACVWHCYRRPMAPALQLAVLLAATVLAAPHLQTYDSVPLALAGVLFFLYRRAHGLHPGDASLTLTLWVSPIFNPPRVIPLGYLTPLLIGAFIWRVMRPPA